MSTPAPDRPLIRSIASFLGFVLVGVGVYAWLQSTKAAPRTRPAQEQGRSVRTIALEPLEVVPRTTGYGAVEAQREWQAVAEVSGTVVEVADRLEPGRVVQAGTVLLKLDPVNVTIEKGRTEAAVKAVRAQIGELKAREASAQQNLKIDERSLTLARSELERVRSLYDQGAAPLTDVEAAERAVITAEKTVQSYRNTLSELPATRRVLEAQLEQQQAGVATSKLTLAKTEVVAPFTMRLREVSVALQQSVSGGQVLLVGDGIDVFEIPAQVPVGTVGQLLPPRDPEEEAKRDPSVPRTPRTAAIEAIVRLDAQGMTSSWKGRYRRSGGIDPNTRMQLAVVEVEDARDPARQGPRLQRGLYVEVELRGPPRPGCLAVPRTAFHDGKLYVAAGDRLELRDVEATLVQEEFVCVAGDVKPGDKIVTSDLVPALPGMLLAPRDDDEGKAALARAAKGAAP